MRYINIFDYKDKRFPFQIFIGGRGTGKTYSAIKGALTGAVSDKFIFMRRTGQECEMLWDTDKGEGANPFKPINEDIGSNVGIKKIIKNVGGIYNRVLDENGKYVYQGSPIGYSLALSTIAGVRGFSFNDVSDWFYDEFIKEKHVRAMTGEGDALLNAYESICRNRELEGREPVYLWMLANSNDIYNPIFITLNIINDVEKMLRSGKSDKYYPERGLAVHLLQPSEEFVNAKSNTALYRLTRGTDFADMALSNKFAFNDFSLIEHRNIVGYRPVCKINDFVIWSKKGMREFYCCYAEAKCPTFNSDLRQDRISFMRRFGARMLPAFSDGRIIFESYAIKQIIVDLLF